MAIADVSGLPVAIDMQSASPHEIKLVEATIKKAPKRIIGDKVYDSDPVNQHLLKEHDMELIAPHKANRKRSKTQDGRALRRYRRRWKIVCFFAWLHNFRKLVVRY
jgi:IS5 family transposase